MKYPLSNRMGRTVLAGVAALFGVVTIIAGARVLGGADPGYTVLRPLLLFNTAMGVAYVIAGALIWRNLRLGRFAAAAVFSLNLMVLGTVAVMYAMGNQVAAQSVQAMTLRTVVWLLLLLGLLWMGRGRAHTSSGAAGGA
jgi:hypothetical protein